MQEILEILRTVVDSVVHLFEYIIKLFAIMGKAVTYIILIFGYMPAWLSGGITVIVAVSVILMILNRG